MALAMRFSPPPSRSAVWREGRRGAELRKDGNRGEALALTHPTQHDLRDG